MKLEFVLCPASATTFWLELDGSLPLDWVSTCDRDAERALARTDRVARDHWRPHALGPGVL
jgi:hypothetical protein